MAQIASAADGQASTLRRKTRVGSTLSRRVNERRTRATKTAAVPPSEGAPVMGGVDGGVGLLKSGLDWKNLAEE